MVKASSNNDEIKIEFDEITEHYYIVWQLRVIDCHRFSASD